MGRDRTRNGGVKEEEGTEPYLNGSSSGGNALNGSNEDGIILTESMQSGTNSRTTTQINSSSSHKEVKDRNNITSSYINSNNNKLKDLREIEIIDSPDNNNNRDEFKNSSDCLIDNDTIEITPDNSPTIQRKNMNNIISSNNHNNSNNNMNSSIRNSRLEEVEEVDEDIGGGVDGTPTNNSNQHHDSTKKITELTGAPQIEIHIDEETNPKSTYDRQQFYEYRESHRDKQSKSGNSSGHSTPSLNTDQMVMDTSDINRAYDQQREEHQIKATGSRWKYFKFLFNKNKYRWDIKNNKRFYMAAQIITRIGFFAKALLYLTLSVISMVAAVDTKRSPLGPAAAFEELQEIFSGGMIFILLIGLWCYGCWGIFYVVFDIDQLGNKGAGPILKRFGRVFSSGFYFVLGVDCAQVLAHTRKDKEGTEQILTLLYKNIVGKILVCVLGVTFFVVSIVYLIYFINPAKFKRELSTERMTKGLYYTSLAFARIGAIGRSMFFAAFGGVLIKAVSDINHGKQGDTTLLGFQGVFRSISSYNYTLLFIIATLIAFYAIWCLWLVFFRRLPAHSDAKRARELLGSKLDDRLRFRGIIFRIRKDGSNPDFDLEIEKQLQEQELNENNSNPSSSTSSSNANTPISTSIGTDYTI